ncbi:predicted protein [Chaetomium globosum CBS 148.51]|uniref:Uncharacterized protein n=1 Tax=Chaetomium globosum (strain ATCC 6205 / CBS 148.51 / DSM 1962 / NBRC 6347 / NRRL 1970) TaxID=306901 RepID=Q2GWA8_CHAGB|nr:uncharacterized protein CHGG_07746 [Chaetomium globosum CBS 148.51]EAQ86493.1 predicted protein [Chaetomium globosum CBS 148.51]
MAVRNRNDKMDGAAGILVALLSLLFLTIWIWFPGVIHALYLLAVYYDRRDKHKFGVRPVKRMPFIFSDKVQSGGATPIWRR